MPNMNSDTDLASSSYDFITSHRKSAKIKKNKEKETPEDIEVSKSLRKRKLFLKRSCVLLCFAIYATNVSRTVSCHVL